MKIFITGMAGFLGSHLADRMIDLGHEVHGCDNLLGGYHDNVPADVETFKSVDCNDFANITKLTKDMDVVVHCAAAPYEGLSVFSPVQVTQHCYMSTVSLVTASVANNIPKFVFTSSMARYGTNQIPFTEDMAPKPQDPYGIAKVASEQFLKCMADTHEFNYAIAVPHNIIGIRQKYDDPYRNVASIMINLMLQGKQPIIYGDGNQKRCFSFVQDTIGSMEKMILDKRFNGETINVGPDEEFVTINELAKTIAELVNFDLKPRYFPDRPQEVKLASCSAEKARNLLGYQTKYTLKEGLQEMIDWIKMRGTKPFSYHLPLEIINHKTPQTWKEKLF